MTTGATPYMPIAMSGLHELANLVNGVAHAGVCGPDGRVLHSPSMPTAPVDQGHDESHDK